MSIKERRKQRKDLGRYDDREQRHWMSLRPSLYKNMDLREQVFHHLHSIGKKAESQADRFYHIKGIRYEDAGEIALTRWL